MSVTLALNGRLVRPEEASVSALDRGLLYGDGVFEVLRAYDGEAFALDAHLERLDASARRIGMSLPVSTAQLRAEVRAALASAGAVDAHLRVLVTRGVGDLGVAPVNTRDATRMVVVTPLAPKPQNTYTKGIRAIVVHAPWLAAGGPTAGAKTLNYLANIAWTREAHAQGAGEAIVVGHNDTLLEGATSNVFVVRGADVATPPLEAGILGGITRAALLSLASTAGVVVREAALTRADLLRADEVFVTSSVREVVPVVQVDDHIVGEGTPGAVTRALHRAYRALTPAAGRAMPWE